MKSYDVTPIPKPRMTKSDAWKKRACVQRYWAYKDEVKFNNIRVPECGYWIIFIMPMPKSWSKKIKEKMVGRPHQQKPDKDNLEKALLDAIWQDDAHIWDGRVSKVWGYEGKIVVIEQHTSEKEQNIFKKVVDTVSG